MWCRIVAWDRGGESIAVRCDGLEKGLNGRWGVLVSILPYLLGDSRGEKEEGGYWGFSVIEVRRGGAV